MDFWQLTLQFSRGGPRSQSSQKTGPRPFFREAPGAWQTRCSMPLNFSREAHVATGWILSPQNSGPILFFRDAPGGPCQHAALCH